MSRLVSCNELFIDVDNPTIGGIVVAKNNQGEAEVSTTTASGGGGLPDLSTVTIRAAQEGFDVLTDYSNTLVWFSDGVNPSPASVYFFTSPGFYNICLGVPDANYRGFASIEDEGVQTAIPFTTLNFSTASPGLYDTTNTTTLNFYPLDGLPCDVAVDLVGLDHLAPASNPAVLLDAPRATPTLTQLSAIKFNTVSRISGTGVLVGETSFGVEMWVKLDAYSGSFSNILEVGYNQGTGFLIYEENNLLTLFSQGLIDFPYLLQVETQNLGEWVHVGFYISSNQAFFYVNGKKQAEDLSGTYNPVQAGHTIFIGYSDAGGNGFDGRVNQLRIFSLNTPSTFDPYLDFALLDKTYDRPTTRTFHVYLLDTSGDAEDKIGYSDLTAVGPPTLSSVIPIPTPISQSNYNDYENTAGAAATQYHVSSAPVIVAPFNYGVEAWLYIDNYGAGRSVVLTNRETATNGGFSVVLTTSGGGPRVEVEDVGGAVTQTFFTIPTGSWQHFGFWNAGGNMNVYINNVLNATSAVNHSRSSANFYIAESETGGEAFDGKIAQMRLFIAGEGTVDVNNLFYFAP